MREIRREADGELEGYVAPDDDAWLALTVFHGLLERCTTRQSAVEVVHRRGLASLAERWHWFSRWTGTWQVVVPQEASPGWVRVAIGWYSLPGVPTTTITSADIEAGDRLTLEAPVGDST